MKIRLLPFIIILGAFAARLCTVAVVRHEFDWGVPHGIGLQIAEALQTGTWNSLPPLNFGSSIGFPNPLLSSWVWALLAFATPNAYVATALSAMLSVAAVAMTYDLTRRLLNRQSAAVASTLMAISPWSIYFANGTWLQGQLEFCTTLVAWLLFVGLQDKSARRVFIALTSAAILMQTYLVAFGLGLQIAVTSLGALRTLRKTMLLGMPMLTLSIGMLLWMQPNDVRDEDMASLSLLSARTLHFDAAHASTDGWDHALRLVSGRAHEVNGIDRTDSNQMVFWTITNMRATLIDVLLLTGFILFALNKLPTYQSANMRWAVGSWFVAPVLASWVIAAMRVHTLVHPFYMLLTAPAGYILASAPFAWLNRVNISKQSWGVALTSLALAVIPAGRIWQFAEYERTHPLIGQLPWLPLREQQRLRQTWHTWCDVLATDDDRRWTASVFESFRNARALTDIWRHNQLSTIIYLDTDQRTCLTQYLPMQLPLAQPIVTTLSNQSSIITNQWDPATLASNISLNSNIGWRLIRADVPSTMIAGQTYTVTQVWRIDSLPSEDYHAWYFAPFVKVTASDNTAIMNIDQAISVLGADWRVGGIIVSAVQIQLPVHTKVGTYQIHLSLFDPNQKKNAVYLQPGKPDPSLEITRNIEVAAQR